jgi:hypothetical protein
MAMERTIRKNGYIPLFEIDFTYLKLNFVKTNLMIIYNRQLIDITIKN